MYLEMRNGQNDKFRALFQSMPTYCLGIYQEGLRDYRELKGYKISYAVKNKLVPLIPMCQEFLKEISPNVARHMRKFLNHVYLQCIPAKKCNGN